jgi:hypothetical protein
MHTTTFTFLLVAIDLANVCQGWSQTKNLPITASTIARIIDMSHCASLVQVVFLIFISIYSLYKGRFIVPIPNSLTYVRSLDYPHPCLSFDRSGRAKIEMQVEFVPYCLLEWSWRNSKAPKEIEAKVSNMLEDEKQTNE